MVAWLAPTEGDASGATDGGEDPGLDAGVAFTCGAESVTVSSATGPSTEAPQATGTAYLGCPGGSNCSAATSTVALTLVPAP